MSSDSSVVPSINAELPEILKRLSDFGSALLDPPASNAELLLLLEEFEGFLSGISQGHDKILRPPLGPSMKALISNELLRHADTDIQIQVLSCITEITRITAPEMPYEDSEMKEYFMLLVESSGRLPSMNYRCYVKVVSILYTVARIKSCVLMLDLEMYAAVLEMLQHFLTSIQSRPSPDLFLDMANIMVMLIEDYQKDDGVPGDFLSTLLDSVKLDKKDISPVSWALGRRILKKSDQHLRPSLAQAVRSLDIDVSDYAQIVASICQEEAYVENMVAQELATHFTGPSGQLGDDPSTSVENNSTAENTENRSTSEPNCLQILGNPSTEPALSDSATSKKDDDCLKDENSLKDLSSGPLKVQEATDLKTSSEAEDINVIMPEECNCDVQVMDRDISTEQNTSNELQIGYQTTHSPLTDNVTTGRRDVSSLKDENALKENTSLSVEVQKVIDSEKTTFEAENDNVSNTVPQELKVPGKRERKRNSLFGLDEGYFFTGIDETAYAQLYCGRKNYKLKSKHISDRKSTAASSGNQSFPNENLCRKGTLKKKGHMVNQDDPEQNQDSLPSQMIHTKCSSGRSACPANWGQESPRETSSQFEVLASRFTSKPTPESQYKRNLSSSKRKASRKTYGERLVGSKIKIWWLLDQKYYEGFVDSFDLSTMQHKIIYDDGDEETLNLMGEVWKPVRKARLLNGKEKILGPPVPAALNLFGSPSSKKRKRKSNKKEGARQQSNKKEGSTEPCQQSKKKEGSSEPCQQSDKEEGVLKVAKVSAEQDKPEIPITSMENEKTPEVAKTSGDQVEN